MVDLKIKTHDGETTYVKVESYDPIAMEEKINSPEVLAIEIGGEIFTRIDIKRVSKQIEEII